MKLCAFLVFFALTAFLPTSLRADENVRALQAKLKTEGFYFGPVDGTNRSDVAAALTRFQIRKGLQITGTLNSETAGALGIQPVNANADANGTANSDTWRQLRQSAGPASVGTARSPTPARRRQLEGPNQNSPTAALVPAGDGDARTFALSPERLRDFVGAFVLAGRDPTVGAEVEFFADHVRYYNDGVVDRQKIANDIRRYDARWPERRFWLAGEPKVQPQPDSRLRVTFPLRFDLVNGSKHSSGTIAKTLLLGVVGRDLQIVAVNEKRLR